MNTTDTDGLPADTSNEESTTTSKAYPSISNDPLAHELVTLKEEQGRLREQLKKDKLQLINRRIMAIENGEDDTLTAQIQNLEANKEKQLGVLARRLSLQKQAIEAKYDAECHEIKNELATCHWLNLRQMH